MGECDTSLSTSPVFFKYSENQTSSPSLVFVVDDHHQFKNQSKIVVWSGRLFEKYPLFVLELASLLAMFWPAQQMSLRGCRHLSRFTLFPIFSPTFLQPLPTPIFSAYNSIYPDSPSFFSPTSVQSIFSAYTSATYSDLTSFLFSHQHLFNLFQTYSHPLSSLFLPTIIV